MREDAALSPTVARLDRVWRLRQALQLATHTNSRMVAAEVGHHLDMITRSATSQPAVAEASDAVRDASLGYLTTVHVQGDASLARRSVLATIDQLESSLIA